MAFTGIAVLDLGSKITLYLSSTVSPKLELENK